MKDESRKVAAKEIANSYAPQPQDGFILYATVGTVLAGTAIFGFGRFYGLELAVYPISILATLISAGLCAIILRAVRSRRHAAAHRKEYDDTEPRT